LHPVVVEKDFVGEVVLQGWVKEFVNYLVARTGDASNADELPSGISTCMF